MRQINDTAAEKAADAIAEALATFPLYIGRRPLSDSDRAVTAWAVIEHLMRSRLTLTVQDEEADPQDQD